MIQVHYYLIDAPVVRSFAVQVVFGVRTQYQMLRSDATLLLRVMRNPEACMTLQSALDEDRCLRVERGSWFYGNRSGSEVGLNRTWKLRFHQIGAIR